MRIVDTIPHPSMTISIFRMNDKFLVKFEAGPMEQTFKFDVDSVGSLEGLRQLISADFIEAARARFNDMFRQLQSVTS
jgi:hypothetical protein